MERDDLIVNDQYSLDAHHDEEAGKKIRKTIWKVAVLLTVITFIEVMMGIYIKRSADTMWTFTKWAFIVMTLFKAGYIVMSFMHLGDERKNLRNVILIPYALFIGYLIFIGLYESTSTYDARTPDIEMVADE